MTVTPDQSALVERFLRYSTISSQSDASKGVVPSSAGQWDLAKLLAKELNDAGAEDVHVSDTAVVTARIPSNVENPEDFYTIGFCTHLDTVDVNLSPDVHAHVVEYDDGDILLNDQKQIWMRSDEHPELKAYIGDNILVTDGTSVLGADDKAGVTSVMETAVRLLEGASFPHGDVYLSFVPDEEIGLRGVRTLDLDRFPVDFAFTLDSCEIGEIVEATFNAATITIHIEGVTAHPMNSKGNLVNPILIAHDIIDSFDREETPENTEDREGYIWVHGIDGNQSTTTLTISVREHDRVKYEEKKQHVAEAVDRARKNNPKATIDIRVEDTYSNIEDAKTLENAVATDRILQAMENLSITPKPLSMRGGTDGSWLSSQGVFTPNFFTGAHNFHSIYEFLPLTSFEKSFLMVRELIRLARRQ